MISILYCASGCETVIDSEIDDHKVNLLVVDGLFTNERTKHTIRLSKSFPVNFDGQPDPALGALLSLSDGAKDYYFSEIPQTGIYQTIDSLQGEPGKPYTLSIQWEGHHYVATDTMPLIPVVNPLSFNPPDQEGFYTWSVPNDHSVKPGNTFETSIEFIHAENNGKKDTTTVTYYNFTGLDASALFYLNQMSQTIKFKKGATIVQKKFSLSAHYYSFLKAIYIETDWRGGLYDLTPANVPTNLSGGAQGFFRTSAVNKLAQIAE